MKFASTFTVFISTLAAAIAFGGGAVAESTTGGAIIESDLVIDEADFLLAIAAAAAEATSSDGNLDPAHRDLQSACDTTAAWHPDYSLGWSGGKCSYTTTCNSPSYSTNLACCQGAYAGQESNYCISQLANPPTNAPTPTSAPTKLGEGNYYPDYSLPWPSGVCILTLPVPSGRPIYSSMLACCKAAYGGQTSGACIANLPNKPTSAPTPTAAPTKPGDGTYYPDYSLAWSVGKCISTLPVPSGRPTYSSMLACCKGAYSGQTNNFCISQLPNPPTSAPTPTPAPTNQVFYPDYSLAWSAGKCISTLPVPSGRPTYSSKAACCAAAYAGQSGGICMA